MLATPIKLIINKESPVPVRDQLVEQIGLQIASGILHSKEKLPSIRALAQKLGIHHSTVTSAYNHLAEVGLLEVRQGSGVRVSGRGSSRDDKHADLHALFKNFLAEASDRGYAFDDVRGCFESFGKRSAVKKILVVDRNRDFHKLLLAELQPHFALPVEPVTYEDLKASPALLKDALVLTSLYHLLPLLDLSIDPTRFVVCNIEPARAEMEMVSSLPAASIVLIVSVSATLLKMATNVSAALRGEQIALRTVLLDDKKELEYMMHYAKAIICDSPSEKTVKKLAGQIPVRVFHLYSSSTLKLIEQRLAHWG